MKRPNTRRNLDMAVRRMFDDEKEYLDARMLMANTIVGQMLPDGAMKGGSAIKMRLGNAGTRFTSDLDIALATDLGE